MSKLKCAAKSTKKDTYKLSLKIIFKIMILRQILLSRTLIKNQMNLLTISFSSSSSKSNDILIVTERAVNQLGNIISPGENLRISVDSGGCSGFEYKMILDKELNEKEDEIIKLCNGTNIVIDKISLNFIRGSKLDYVEDLMRSAFRITENPKATNGCSCGSMLIILDMLTNRVFCYFPLNIYLYNRLQSIIKRKNPNFVLLTNSIDIFYQNNSSNYKEYFDEQKNKKHWKGMLAFTFFGIFGFEDWKKLDDDPLKDKVKWAMLHRKYQRYQNAIEELNEGLKLAQELGNQKYITRLYDELANTYYESNNFENSENLFRLVIHRLISIHQKTESSPEFIAISLKLADIFAKKGDIISADIGYKHCLKKQIEESDKALGKFYISHGAHVELKTPMDQIGLDFTEPFALLGMCFHEYALFLVDFYPERIDEAKEYINEALKISYKIYGVNAPHALNIIVTFSGKCVLKNHFTIARDYLEIGIKRVLSQPENENILLSYYCCYSEALFHTGEKELAVDYAERAAKIAKDGTIDPAIREYVNDFVKQIRRDATRSLRSAINAIPYLFSQSEDIKAERRAILSKLNN
ncbi:hypothetical protein Mgra_00001996 [Meloidogyne graminicola]|uniref:Core domain-containing protein n=1 Tax=Meloidogyne graminicola TaxID=189291 RepID=A0A8S9ZZB4_9BILA|nr:hypothetical protein Mgra_00001996 [Meloidogyne graminicola]